mmetsp:Transcript_20074/g.34509  ORF Transcript_20074/g.34509 Transcript_20074/m.34509 type:complete len:405 (+) Transcript_20074:4605-5819(+)
MRSDVGSFSHRSPDVMHFVGSRNRGTKEATASFGGVEGEEAGNELVNEAEIGYPSEPFPVNSSESRSALSRCGRCVGRIGGDSVASARPASSTEFGERAARVCRVLSRELREQSWAELPFADPLPLCQWDRSEGMALTVPCKLIGTVRGLIVTLRSCGKSVRARTSVRGSSSRYAAAGGSCVPEVCQCTPGSGIEDARYRRRMGPSRASLWGAFNGGLGFAGGTGRLAPLSSEPRLGLLGGNAIKGLALGMRHSTVWVHRSTRTVSAAFSRSRTCSTLLTCCPLTAWISSPFRSPAACPGPFGSTCVTTGTPQACCSVHCSLDETLSRPVSAWFALNANAFGLRGLRGSKTGCSLGATAQSKCPSVSAGCKPCSSCAAGLQGDNGSMGLWTECTAEACSDCAAG